MVFSSLVFLCVFLPVNFVLYFIYSNKTYRNWVLIISSLFFYAWGEPVWVILLIFTSVFDYFNGLLIERYRGSWKKKVPLIASIIVNLSILFFFKYSAFLTININQWFGISLPYSNFRLPIGISFYTFQTLSYVVDVYRGEVQAQKSPFKLLLFVSLFHQLVAGPIVRYTDIMNQVDKRIITRSEFIYGINRFAIGLGKKVIFANTAGEIASMYLNGELAKLSVLGAWFGIALYAMQIYFDFSGYSDMAIGLGKMFGFTYKENFAYPYISKSATEFWRRWHISLGSFFRDYVYIPLGGNRRHQIRNLAIVWVLTGLWHGASWNFIMWGAYYGILIIIEKFALLKVFAKIPQVVSHCYLIVAMLVGWVFFYYTDLSKAMHLLGVMFGVSGNPITDTKLQIDFMNNLIFIGAAVIACTPAFNVLCRKLGSRMENIHYGLPVMKHLVTPIFNFAILMICITLLVGKTYNPFLYFRF